jgi:hypothetical protein
MMRIIDAYRAYVVESYVKSYFRHTGNVGMVITDGTASKKGNLSYLH